MNATSKPPPEYLRRAVYWRTLGLPERVRRGLAMCVERHVDAYRMPQDTEAERAAYYARMAELCDREARWWAVLESWVYSPRSAGVNLVFGRAVIVAEASAREL